MAWFLTCGVAVAGLLLAGILWLFVKNHYE